MKILAVDGNSVLNRAFYGIKALNNSAGIPTNALTGFTNILLKHVESVRPDAVIVAFDRKAPTFRHLLYDGYKANRKGMPDELAAQLPYSKEIASLLGAAVVEKDGIEADDILGTVSATCTKKGDLCYILTGDRDSFQLIDDRSTKVLLLTNAETVAYDEAEFEKKYLTKPSGLVDIKALMGDSSDCIPGVKGIGEKTAIALISEYGTLENVYENVDTLPVGPSAKEKIRNDREMAFLSKKLAKIKCDADIGDVAGSSGKPDKDGLVKLLTELEMFASLKKVLSSSVFAEEDAPAEDFSNAEKVTYKDVGEDEARRLLSGGNAALEFDAGNSDAYICSGGEVVKAHISDLVPFLADNYRACVVFDSKKLYKYLLENGVRPDGTVAFDVMLAAYIVNSGMQKYTLDRLIAHYLKTVDADITPASAAKYAAALYPILQAKLEESGQEGLYRGVELPLAVVIADMEKSGFYVDAAGLEKFGKVLEADAAELENRIYFMTGETFNINSPKQLGTVLFDHLGLPCKKKSKSGYSTDAETLEALAPYHEVIGSVLDYRAVTKLKSTFVDAMLKVISPDDGRVRTNFNQATTATGRLSSTEPNLQNIPIRTERGRELRRFFKAREGFVLIDADYSQIELRLLAEISGDAAFKDAFISGKDIHRVTASQVFGVPEELVSSEMRSKAKAVNFGIIYGISAFSLAKDIGTSVAEAKRYIDGYIGKYPGVSAYLESVVADAEKCGYVTTMFGRRRYIPELFSPKRPVKSFGERVARNSPIQGTAADIIKLAMINVHSKLSDFEDAKLILQVHDELIIEAPEKDAPAIAAMLKSEMESVAKTDVPLSVDVNIGKTWYDTKN